MDDLWFQQIGATCHNLRKFPDKSVISVSDQHWETRLSLQFSFGSLKAKGLYYQAKNNYVAEI